MPGHMVFGTTMPRCPSHAVLWLLMTAVTPARLENALMATQGCYTRIHPILEMNATLMPAGDFSLLRMLQWPLHTLGADGVLAMLL
jgi:hypothetical protein